MKYVKNGTIRGGFIWNPMTAGEVFVQLASLLAAGEAKGRDGAGRRRRRAGLPDKKLIQAQKLEALDKANIDRLVELGL